MFVDSIHVCMGFQLLSLTKCKSTPFKRHGWVIKLVYLEQTKFKNLASVIRRTPSTHTPPPSEMHNDKALFIVYLCAVTFYCFAAITWYRTTQIEGSNRVMAGWAIAVLFPYILIINSPRIRRRIFVFTEYVFTLAFVWTMYMCSTEETKGVLFMISMVMILARDDLKNQSPPPLPQWFQSLFNPDIVAEAS